MEIKVNIDEASIVNKVTDMLVEEVVRAALRDMDLRAGVRSGLDKAVKEYIYSEKDNIIEKVIERASREIVKKGLPRMLENLGKGL